MARSPKAYWVISGFDGTKQLFQETVAYGCLSDGEVITLLQRLASRDLTPSEVVSASSRRSAKRYAPHLVVQRDSGRRMTYYVGTNPHYVATVVREAELKDFEGLYE